MEKIPNSIYLGGKPATDKEIEEFKKASRDLINAVPPDYDALREVFKKKLIQESGLDRTWFDPNKKPTLWQKFKAWKIWHIRLVDIRDYHHEDDCDY